MSLLVTKSNENSAHIVVDDEEGMPTYQVSVEMNYRGVLVVTVHNEGGAPLDLAYVGYVGETTDLRVTVNDEEVDL